MHWQPCTEGQDSPPRISAFGVARAARSAYLGLCSAGERYLRVNLKEMWGRTGEHAFAAYLQTQGFLHAHGCPCPRGTLLKTQRIYLRCIK